MLTLQKRNALEYVLKQNVLESAFLNYYFSTNYLFTIIHLAWRRRNNEEPILTTLERRLVLLSHSSSCNMDWDR